MDTVGILDVSFVSRGFVYMIRLSKQICRECKLHLVGGVCGLSYAIYSLVRKKLWCQGICDST
jgi:hypothetical protein